MGSDVFFVGSSWRVYVREVVRRAPAGRWSSFTVEAVARLPREFGSLEQAEWALDRVESVYLDVTDAAPISRVAAG